MCVAPPRLYGQLKIHKEGHPIRPAVAFYTASSYKLAKFLAKLFVELTNFQSERSIKNSIELADDLEQRSFPAGSCLVSLDAVAMYTRTPVDYTIGIMLTLLTNAQVHRDIVVDEFNDLLKLPEGQYLLLHGEVLQVPGWPTHGRAPVGACCQRVHGSHGETNPRL